MERYRLLGIEHDGRESASARVVSREPNKWGVFPLHTFNSGDEVVLAADAQATIAALQAQLTQLDRTLADVYAQREGLQKDLAQRTAELAQILAAVDEGLALTDIRLAIKTVEETQAELERVRGEIAHAKKMEAVQKEVADNQTWHVQKLRTLLLALPTVEGEVEVYHHESGLRHSVVARPANTHYSSFDTPEEAEAYAALLQHRQGMEG